MEEKVEETPIIKKTSKEYNEVTFPKDDKLSYFTKFILNVDRLEKD